MIFSDVKILLTQYFPELCLPNDIRELSKLIYPISGICGR